MMPAKANFDKNIFCSIKTDPNLTRLVGFKMEKIFIEKFSKSIPYSRGFAINLLIKDKNRLNRTRFERTIPTFLEN